MGGTAPLGLQAPRVLAASVRPSAWTGGGAGSSRLIPARGAPGPVSCTPRVPPLLVGEFPGLTPLLWPSVFITAVLQI